MILIRKGHTNEITLTLTENCDLSSPHFLFWFFNPTSKQEIKLILADTSQFTERYNKFTFTEPTTAELTEGFWEYKVYEQANNSNLDPIGLNMVEQGKMKVIDESNDPQPSIYDSQTKEGTVYP